MELIMIFVGSMMLVKFLCIESLSLSWLFMFLLGMLLVENVQGLVIFGFNFGSDLISMSLVNLSLWIGYLSLIGIFNMVEDKKFCLVIMMVVFFLMLSFMITDMLLFYVFFELVLIPSFLLIMWYGNQFERLESVMYMLFYTLFGSLPLLILLLFYLNSCGSLNYMYIGMGAEYWSSNYEVFLVLGFLVKLPMYGFHLWLPKAHVEASVSGSMILAGILLKLGGYGLYRIMYLSKGLSLWMEVFMVILGLWGGLLSALICFRQLDLKKLIAYSSVVHMGFMLSGLMSNNHWGYYGGVVSMIGHGLCSSALFYLVNSIYERCNSRVFLIAKGSLSLVPGGSLWGFLLSISSMAAPPFLGFFSEILLSMSLVKWGWWNIVLLLILFFLSAGYSMYFYSMISHGNMINIMISEFKFSEYFLIFLHFVPLIVMVNKIEISYMF